MADAPAADGGGADDLLRRLVEAVEAGEEQLVEPGRDLPFTGDGGELLGEERVAVGPLEHGADQRLRRPRPEDAAQLLGDVAGAERRQPDVLDALGSLQLGEQAAHRITRVSWSARYVATSITRESSGPPARRVRRSRVERSAQWASSMTTTTGCSAATRRSAAGSASAGRAGALAPLLPSRASTSWTGAYGRATVGHVEALPGDDDGAGRSRSLAQLCDQARLTDPCVATHEHGRRRPGDRCLQGDDQLPQLLGAPDEPRTGHP